MCKTYVYQFSFGDSTLPPFYHLRLRYHNKLLAATTTSSSNSKLTLIMKVSLFSLLALASSAWAKDSTVVNKGSNRNLKASKETPLRSAKKTPGGKAGKSNGCGDSTSPRTIDSQRAMTLILMAQSYLQTLGIWEEGMGFVIPLASVSTLESLLPGLIVIDTDGDEKIVVNELVDALSIYFDDESLEGFVYVCDAGATDCPASAPFFGYMGVTSALVFANIGAAYGTAKSGVGASTPAL